MTLIEDLRRLADIYEQAARDPINEGECMYDSACSQFADALRELLDKHEGVAA